MVDTLYEYDPYFQLPLKFEHSPNHKFALANHDSLVANLLEEQDDHTWSPKQYDNLNFLSTVKAIPDFPLNNFVFN